MTTERAASLDTLFAALSDSTRRTIIEQLLAKGELSVGDVAARFDMTTPAITHHLQVLERAGLVDRRSERQFRFVRVRANALMPLENWVTRQQRHWTAALDRLEALVAAQTPRSKKS